MKRNFTKLSLVAIALCALVNVNAQGAKGWGGMGLGEYPRVINENFQNWPKTHSVASQELITLGGTSSVSSTWQNGLVQIPVYNNDDKTDKVFTLDLLSCAVAPTFDTQYTHDATKTEYPKDLVSTGFIELGRISYEPKAPVDGELIIPQMEFIEGIQYSFASVGGNKRGFALYKSVNGGEWELIRNETGNITTSTSGTNMQESGYGQRFEEVLYAENTRLKFGLSPQNAQIVRIYDLKVYGIVGDGNSISNSTGSAFIVKNIKGNISISVDANVELITVAGQVVKSANNVSELSIQDLPSGVYVVKATAVGSGEVQTKKIIK